MLAPTMLLSEKEHKLAVQWRWPVRRSHSVIGCAAILLVCALMWHGAALQKCEPQTWQRQQLSLRGLEYVDFEWMRNRYGHLIVYAAESSRTRGYDEFARRRA